MLVLRVISNFNLRVWVKLFISILKSHNKDICDILRIHNCNKRLKITSVETYVLFFLQQKVINLCNLMFSVQSSHTVELPRKTTVCLRAPARAHSLVQVTYECNYFVLIIWMQCTAVKNKAVWNIWNTN